MSIVLESFCATLAARLGSREGENLSTTLDWLARIVAAVILALTAFFLFRWDISAVGNNLVRLDRWTGQIALCIKENKTNKILCGDQALHLLDQEPSK
jgi:hypothetical protein